MGREQIVILTLLIFTGRGSRMKKKKKKNQGLCLFMVKEILEEGFCL